MATINDKFSKVSTGVRPLTTTVDGTRATSGATLSCADLTGWDTDKAVHGVTYKLDGQGAIIAGSQLDFKGVVSGNTITNFTVTGGIDAGNAVGDIVQATPTAAWAKDLADGILTSLDDDGTLKAGAVDNAAALASNVVTTAKIADRAVTAAKLSSSAITLGYAEVTSGQAVTNSTETDLTGLTVTITADGVRRILITAYIPTVSATATGNATAINIKEGTTVLSYGKSNITAGTQVGPMNIQYSTVASAGSHTYKLSLKNDVSATTTMLAYATSPAFILVTAI